MVRSWSLCAWYNSVHIRLIHEGVLRMILEFHSEPFTDFSRPEKSAAFRTALDNAKAEIGKTYPLVIGGKQISLQDIFPSINPSRPAEILGNFANGTPEHVNQAVEAAAKAFKTWQYVPV